MVIVIVYCVHKDIVQVIVSVLHDPLIISVRLDTPSICVWSPDTTGAQVH